jgi:hypothetical protein
MARDKEVTPAANWSMARDKEVTPAAHWSMARDKEATPAAQHEFFYFIHLVTSDRHVVFPFKITLNCFEYRANLLLNAFKKLCLQIL